MDNALEDAIRGADEAMRRLRWATQAREAAARRARCPEGRYLPKGSRNRTIAAAAILRQPVPGDAHAGFWVTHVAHREEWLRIRRDLPELELASKLLDPDALNGYVAFDKRHAPRVGDGTGNIVQYIPVHGGVTYAEKDSYAAVWGFDTMHCRSEEEPRTDPAWILANCYVLYRGLKLGAELWPEFRRANCARRAELAQQLIDLNEEQSGQPLHQRLGFEALINLMTGQVG